MERIGFIGCGVMGNAMAGHLLDAGYEVTVYNRTKSRTDNLVAKGATWADSPAAVAEAADVVISMVGYPSDVEEIYMGTNGIIEHARADALLIDMTTSSPALAEKLAAMAAARGLRMLDAPVSGGDTGAKNATLTIMVGGTQEDFDRALPLFKVMGTSFALHGGPGKGQHAKMANQINIAATMLGMAESLAYAKAAGLDPMRVIETLSGGSAQTWSLSNYGPRVLKGDYAAGFYVKHFIKDLKIALEQASEAGLDLPATRLATELYVKLAQDHDGDNYGTQAIMLMYLGEN